METIRMSHFVALSSPPWVYYQGEHVTYAAKSIPQEPQERTDLYLICTENGGFYVNKDILLQVQS